MIRSNIKSFLLVYSGTLNFRRGATENIDSQPRRALARQTTPSSQSTSTITTTLPTEMGKYIRTLVRPCLPQLKGWSSGTRSKASGRAAVGLDQIRNSIPMSIPTHSQYIERSEEDHADTDSFVL